MNTPLLILYLLFALPAMAQVASVVEAEFVQLPGVADSNSPSHWSDGRLIVFNSDGMPLRSEGDGVHTLGHSRAVRLYTYDNVPMWIEATYKAPDGVLYAWYHHEVFLNCEANPLSAPEIGALMSFDDGITFFDLGIIIQAGHQPNCESHNRYFGGGVGDFSVIADQQGEYLYFLYSSYAGDASNQGVAIARLALSDIHDPVGKVFKYFNGEWIEPGLGGVESPVFAASSSWDSEAADAFWGPSIHWNSYLESYVMVMNHTCCTTDWPQEGTYISYSTDLSRPWLWTQPEKVFDGGGWYPMVMGLNPGETDKLAGQRARLFQGSDSRWEIVFEKPLPVEPQ